MKPLHHSHAAALVRGLLIVAVIACSSAQAAPPVLVENATIITAAADDDAPFIGYLITDTNGRISAIGKGAYPALAPADTVRIDARGKILLPGFLSGHNHLWQSAWRGIAQDGELWPWLQALHWTYGEHFAPDDMYWFTLHGALDELRHGITTTYNHSQRLRGSNDENAYLGQLRAEVDAGAHFVFAYVPDGQVDNAERARKLGAVLKSYPISQDPSALLGFSINSVGLYGDGKVLEHEIELAHAHGLTVQIHYLEQYQRRVEDRKKWPLLKRSGAVAKGTSFAHFIQVTPKILDEAARGGAAMIWNPLSNGRLASGLSDIPAYLKAGLGVGMGVDGQASGDIADPFQNMRMGLYALRMQTHSAKVMSPLDVIRLHTLSTAKVLGIEAEVGSLEVGKRADFLIVDPADPATGPLIDAAATTVFACDASNVEQIFIDGELAVYRGQVLAHDVGAVGREVAKRVQSVMARQAAAEKPVAAH